MVARDPMIRHLADHAPEDGEFVGDLCKTRKSVGDNLAGLGFDDAEGTADVDWRLGFGVEGFLLVESARQVDLDDALGAGLYFCTRIHSHHCLVGRAKPKEIAHGKSERAKHTRLYCLAPGHRSKTRTAVNV